MKPHTLVKWAILLGGPLIWFAHFGFVYTAASLELTLVDRAGLPSRVAIGLATVLACGLIIWLILAVYQNRLPRWETAGDDLRALWRRVSLFGAALSLAAVIWQALPALMIPIETVSHEALPPWSSR